MESRLRLGGEESVKSRAIAVDCSHSIASVASSSLASLDSMPPGQEARHRAEMPELFLMMILGK